MADERWREAHALLVARAAAAPDALVASLAAAWPPLDRGTPRRLVTTGVGSSEAHARFLAHVVDRAGGVPARFAPLGALVEPPRHAGDDVLVAFTQGLSANACLVLERARAWHRAIVATAASDEQRLAPLRAGGVQVVPFEGRDEFGTLVRVLGPLAAYGAALRLAAAFGADLPFDPGEIRRALAAARQAAASVPPDVLDLPAAFLVSGEHGELTRNLQLQLLEGLLVPLPPVWELLHVGHGPFQQAFAGPQAFLALTRRDAPGEEALLARLEGMLEPARHRLVRLPATLPGPLAILEHEVAVATLMLAGVARRGLDQARWPGRGRDAPLYALAEPPARALDLLAWPEVEALVARGAHTAVLPLGSIEQHGPHLPLATDAWIAEALAERLCAAVPGTLACPVVRVGCASEHLGFPGTLHVEPGTLEATLRDQVRALGRHGITRVFVFSAHGGNVAALAGMLAALRADCAPVEVVAYTDLDGLTAALHAAARTAGVDAAAAGHHAGELETSILLALRPGDVRLHALAAGLLAPDASVQHLFYPDVRTHAPAGTIGDPRCADARRGLVYLATWTGILAAALEGAKKSP